MTFGGQDVYDDLQRDFGLSSRTSFFNGIHCFPLNISARRVYIAGECIKRRGVRRIVMSISRNSVHRRPVRSLITPCVGSFRESGRRFYLINAVRSAATVIRRSWAIVKLNERGSPEHIVMYAREVAGCYRDCALSRCEMLSDNRFHG